MQKHQQEITQAMEGDHQAFRKLVDYYQHPAFTLTFRILCDEEEAKDTVQEGFVKIWQRLDKYNPSQPFSSWLYRIMANCAIDRFRVIRRRNEVSLEQVETTLEQALADDPVATLDNQEIARLIRFLAGELPQKQQLVFILRDVQGMSVSDIRNVLGISDIFIKSNLYYARKSIRQKLAKLYSTERRHT